MKNLLIILTILLTFGVNAIAQTCPANMVCLTREVAEKALRTADEADALRSQVKTLESVIADERAASLAREQKYQAEMTRLLADVSRYIERAAGFEKALVSAEAREMKWLALVETLTKRRGCVVAILNC